jgi:hypothetical protein
MWYANDIDVVNGRLPAPDAAGNFDTVAGRFQQVDNTLGDSLGFSQFQLFTSLTFIYSCFIIDTTKRSTALWVRPLAW